MIVIRTVEGCLNYAAIIFFSEDVLSVPEHIARLENAGCKRLTMFYGDGKKDGMSRFRYLEKIKQQVLYVLDLLLRDCKKIDLLKTDTRLAISGGLTEI